ncbi:hypothetical protein E2C01_048057 [Portunus trituberculatus]|uniref:Uncharacterized protein n=1 Tax=Portunus trituberculatus TaxID=210409 RepID=A0A5B7G2P1_PORTR|nr:hypothetical protein [Portunus trituberculatus]
MPPPHLVPPHPPHLPAVTHSPREPTFHESLLCSPDSSCINSFHRGCIETPPDPWRDAHHHIHSRCQPRTVSRSSCITLRSSLNSVNSIKGSKGEPRTHNSCEVF